MMSGVIRLATELLYRWRPRVACGAGKPSVASGIRDRDERSQHRDSRGLPVVEARAASTAGVLIVALFAAPAMRPTGRSS